MLHLRNRRCLVVGAGKVGCRRARLLQQHGASVIVIDPDPKQNFDGADVELRRRPFQDSDLADIFLVVAATNDRQTNAAIGARARSQGILINRADQPDDGDIEILAHQSRTPLTVCVHSGGTAPPLAAWLARELADSIDPRILEYAQLLAKQRHRPAHADESAPGLAWMGSREAFELFCDEGFEAVLQAGRRSQDRTPQGESRP